MAHKVTQDDRDIAASPAFDRNKPQYQSLRSLPKSQPIHSSALPSAYYEDCALDEQSGW